MQAAATKYLTVETASSAVCNGLLNWLSAYALFHKRSLIPTGGPTGLVRDSLGETFFVISLSILIPQLIARQRRRAGTLPDAGDGHAIRTGNLYVRAFAVGLIVTLLCWAPNAFLLPRLLPDGASLHNVLLFKTLYGIVLGAIATYVALRRALHMVG